MFWGLIMEPGKKYSQKVEKSFHVSHAALDLDSASNEAVQVLLGFDKRNYLICTLKKGSWIQAPLDLNFQVGDVVSFATNGPGHVHLTGYLVPEDDFDMGDEEEDDEDEAVELKTIKQKTINDVDSSKKRKAAVLCNDMAPKKSKTALLLEEVGDESDDSDDSDVNLTDMMEDEDDDDEGEEDVEDDVEDDDDEDAEEEENESDEGMEDENSSEEEVEQVEKKSKGDKKKVETPTKQNGIPKKQEKTPKGTPGGNKEKPSEINLKSPQVEKQLKSPQSEKQAKTPKGQKTPGKDGTPQKKQTLEGGVTVEELKIGEGPVAKPGKLVQVYYEGRFRNNNKMFDSSVKGPGFRFRLGRAEVIKGWDVGVAGMKVGGKRRIVCPANMAYGAEGSPPVIPPNSSLVFEVELKNVK